VSEPKVRHVLLVTRLFFFTVIAVCLLINHSATAETDGISFYAV
jgi:nitrogen fixation protein FixH